MMKFKIIVLIGLFAMLHLVSAQTLVPADNATNVSYDMQFQLRFSSAPVIQRSGKIRLYKNNGTLVETIDLSVMPWGTPTSATWPWTDNLNGTIIRVVPVTVDENAVYIRFSKGAMAYNTSYYITVDLSVFSNAASLGFNGVSANNWRFTTRAQPTADLSYTVSADGTGDFATLQGALDFLPATGNAKIYIKNGLYIGLAFIKNKNGYTIEGESKAGVIIKGYNNSNLNASTHWRSVINLQGNDIKILNLTLINTTPNGGTQAEVLKIQGERVVVANCEFYSYQDTLLIEGKVYFIDCMIEGDVDFIWGTGTVFFQSCELRANDNGGYNVMARNDNTKHGYAFADCNLTRKSSSTVTQYLGRDANTSYPYAEIVYLNCTMGPQIPSDGWKIRNEMDASKLVFAEYKSVNQSGGLINTSSRHAKSRQLSQSQATQYRDLNWFFNGWTPIVPDYKTKSSDCNGVVDGSAKLDECGRCTGGNTGLDACTQDCTGEWGGVVATDNCGACLTDDSVKPCSGSLEAETACSVDGILLENKNAGFSGEGYVNANNVVGASIKWILNSDINQVATISFRYANGSATSRGGAITSNENSAGNIVLFPTGAWTTWRTASINLNLVAGSNTIVVAATSADGLANIDVVSFSDGVSNGNCLVTKLNVDLDSEVTIYPNPSTDSFMLESQDNSTVELFTSQGKLITSYHGVSKLEFGSELQAGIYLVKTGSSVFKIVKK